MQTHSQQALSVFQCRVSRKIFEKRDTGFAIISVQPGVGAVVPTHNGIRPLTCVVKGNFSSILEHVSQGLEIRCYGKWELRDGELQFDAKFAMEAVPTTMASLEKLLSSGKFKGIGPVLARRIVSRFGSDSMQILSQTPERLSEIEGISKEGALLAGESWNAWKGANGIVDFLRERGVGEAVGERIWKALGMRSLEIIKRSPYELTKIPFVGFKTADKIAMAEGVMKNSPFRLAAAVKHVLDETLKTDGDFALKESVLLRRAQLLMNDENDRSEIQSVIDAGVDKGRLTIKTIDIDDGKGGQRYVSMPSLLALEVEAASELSRLSSAPSLLNSPVHKFSDVLDESQRFALASSLSSKISVMTGGPGTGKTFTLNSVLSSLKESDSTLKTLLCAPTGKAANRMEKATGHPAQTIHRALEYVGSEFRRGKTNKLNVDFVGVDEGSMIDAYTGLALLRALPDHASLLLIGDVDQLKPVGPGAFFSDIISSNCFPVARLNEGHRFEEGSGIVKAAHMILNSEVPPLSKWDDFVFVHSADDACKDNVCGIVNDLLLSGVSPDAVQILTPQYDGAAGANVLNASLKRILNASFSDEDILSGLGEKFRFSVGDRLMQCKNNYDFDIFNGDVGLVREIDAKSASMLMDFDGKCVEIDSGSMGDLRLSYAMTVHKSQGSEFDYVIVPVTNGHSFMLNSSLLYTGITRAKKGVFIVGDEEVFSRTIKMVRNISRITFLSDEIRKELSRRSVIAPRR